MNDMLLWVAMAVLASLALSVVRVLRGPTPADRMMGAQLAGTGGVALLILLAGVQRDPAVLDAALILALLASLGAVAFVKTASGDGGGDPEE
jgi:multicomponent Na+:H+ antiporter subunit F